MKLFKFLATLMSLAMAGVGVLGLVAPAVLLDFGRSLLAPPGLYWAAVGRVVFGVLLVCLATQSRLPRTLRVIGVIIVIAGLLTPLAGSGQFHAAFASFAEHGPGLVRTIAVVPILAGAFFIYALNARRDR